MIDYAGVGLVAPSADAAAFLREWWHADQIRETEPQGYLTAMDSQFPTPYPPSQVAPRLGVLIWPTGASRWAEFHHLVSGTQLAAIRTALGSGNGPATLTLSDGTTTITPSMYMLPPRPVCQSGADELYLLTLVDERWYWWLAGDQAIPADPVSYSALLTTLGGYVSVVPTVDTIPAAYGVPSSRWADTGPQPVPLLLDAAAALVGCRIVRTLAGAVRVDRWATAKANQDTQYTAADRHRVTGGRVATADIGRVVPSSAQVIFYGPPAAGINKTLTGLAIADYGAAAGVSGRIATVWVDASASDATLATEAATDYYRWSLANVDATYRGVVAWVPSGVEDSVEWEFDYAAVRVVTRVLRGPWADANLYGSSPVVNTGGTSFIVARINGDNGAAEPNTRYSFEPYIWTSGGGWTLAGVTLSAKLIRLPVAEPSPTAGGRPKLQTGDFVLAWPNPDASGFYLCTGETRTTIDITNVVTGFNASTCTATQQTARVTGSGLTFGWV